MCDAAPSVSMRELLPLTAALACVLVSAFTVAAVSVSPTLKLAIPILVGLFTYVLVTVCSRKSE